jgi:hypothetical protein
VRSIERHPRKTQCWEHPRLPGADQDQRVCRSYDLAANCHVFECDAIDRPANLRVKIVGAFRTSFVTPGLDGHTREADIVDLLAKLRGQPDQSQSFVFQPDISGRDIADLARTLASRLRVVE